MIKINKKIFKNIIVLLTTSALVKLLGMLSKILLTNFTGLEVIKLYTLIVPTFMLVVSISQFSFPISISKIVADNKYDDNDIIKNSLYISLFINIVLSIILFFSANLISKLIGFKELNICIKAIILILPFVSISAIIRGFLYGKENMVYSSYSNILEEIVKILLIVFLIPIFINKSKVLSVSAIILFNIITEIVSIFYLKYKINKLYYIKKGKLKINVLKDIFKLSITTTFIKVLGTIGYFLEPIILLKLLMNTGLSKEYITTEYAIISSYIIPLLNMPTFFTGILATVYLPNLTKLFNSKKEKEFDKKVISLSFLSIIIGIICIIFIIIFQDFLLEKIYNLNVTRNYINQIAPVFLFLYIQPILSIAIQASNKITKLFYIVIISLILKYLVLFIFTSLQFGIISFLIYISAGIIINTISMIILIIKKG